MAIMTEGFPTTMTFADAASGVALYFEEQAVTPPGVDGGGPNDVTNMRNTAWRTKYPKTLKSLSGSQMTCHYDPAFIDGILSMINTNQSILLTFPDEQTWTFFGWIDKFMPNEIVEGSAPTATVTIEVSNIDGSGDEIAPVLA